MVILGPNVVENGMNSDTAIMGFGDGMACLGPAVGPSTAVDLIARLFVTLGKLISVRRVLTPVEPGVTDFGQSGAHPIKQYGAIQEAVIGFDAPGEFELVWRPLVASIQQHAIDPLERQAADLDQRTRRFIAAETQTVLALDPSASVEERMGSLDEYLKLKGFTVEAANYGFHDFIARSFRGHDGIRIDLPTSSNPSFPDSWITPTPIDPHLHGGSRREWAILL
jgi:hypothetical protein